MIKFQIENCQFELTAYWQLRTPKFIYGSSDIFFETTLAYKCLMEVGCFQPRKKGCDTGSLTSDVRTRGKLTLEDLEIIRHKIFLLRWQKSTAESDVKELRAQLQSARIEIAALRCRQDASAQELVA